MYRSFNLLTVSLLAACSVLCSLEVQAAVIRSNGKGGGLWSAPATWEGGKVPSGDSVAILGKDVVDVDASAGNKILCEEVVIDPQGALRIVGKNKTTVTFDIRKALRIFGGMIVDFSKDPEGRCEFQWNPGEGSAPELLLNEKCKVLWKGVSSNAIPNVAFRIVAPTNAPAVVPFPKPVPFTLGTKIWIECTSVMLEGFDIQAVGVDGSGLKYNEACSFRNCRFIRSPVTFQSCTKIEFEGNVSQDSPAHGIYLYSTSHSRIVSNVLERAGPSSGGVQSYGASDCELVANTLRSSYYGMNLVACADLFLNENRFENNSYCGLMLNSCTRITSQRSLFTSNAVVDAIAVYATPGEPMRFFDCVFQNPPTNANAACLSADGAVAMDIINSPLQTYMKGGVRGPITFSAYVDIFVTNEPGEPLGRVPIRVLSGDKVIATSRTEAVGAVTGHTPLPASHRPLVVPWYRFAPTEGLSNPAPSMTYQLEVDGTTMGYVKQVIPLVVDASFVRPDPNKPTKTIPVKLPKAK